MVRPRSGLYHSSTAGYSTGGSSDLLISHPRGVRPGSVATDLQALYALLLMVRVDGNAQNGLGKTCIERKIVRVRARPVGCDPLWLGYE